MSNHIPKFDERMFEILSNLETRLGSSSDKNLALYVDRVLNELTKQTSVKLTREEITTIIKESCWDNINDMQALLNCVMRQIPRVLANRLPTGVASNTTLAYPNYVSRISRGDSTQIGVVDSTKEEFPSLALVVQELLSSGLFLDTALQKAIAPLSLSKQLDFLTWFGVQRERESGNKKDFKYLAKAQAKTAERSIHMNFNKVAFSDGSFAYEFMRQREQFAEDQGVEQLEQNYSQQKPSIVAPVEQEDKNKEFRQMRDKMVNRTFSIDKLLEKYRALLSPEQFESIEDVLNTLRKNIRRLKLASLDDSIEKTANCAERNSWFEGAMLIRAIKDEETFIKTAGKIERPQELEEILSSLEEISSYLRQRGIVRELAARDIDLFNLGFGYMSEIGEAAAKLVEAFNSAANKIDDAIGEMKSELQANLKPKGAPRSVKSIVDPSELPLVRALRPSQRTPPAPPTNLLDNSVEELDQTPTEINDEITDEIERPAPRLLRPSKLKP